MRCKRKWLTLRVTLENTRYGKTLSLLSLLFTKQPASSHGLRKRDYVTNCNGAVVSIPSNIAEGSARPTDADFVHFLDIALGSCYEVETQLAIANNVGYIDNTNYKNMYDGIVKIERQLIALIRSIRRQ